MLTFTRPSVGDKGGAHKLPMPIEGLDKLGVSIRRGEVSMIAGVPGAGKSSMALVLALQIGVPTLYVAADTSEETMRVRTLASVTSVPQHDCEKALLNEEPGWFDRAAHIGWCFDPAPSVQYIELEIAAYVEIHGVAPSLIVVDNLIDVAGDSGDEWQALRATMKELKVLARHYDTAVLVLHHVSEGGDRFAKAPGRAAIQGKVAQLPALVLTLDTVAETDTMHVGIVKNRFGKAAPNGSFGCALEFDPVRMQLRDKKMRF